MMNNKLILTVVMLALGVGIGLAVPQLSRNDISPGASGEKKILYWVAPMDPNYRSDKPGKSPMGMDLIPVYEGEEPGSDNKELALRINPAVVNNLGVRTAPVERGTLSRPIRTVGYVVPNDNLFGHVHVRTEGWIEELSVKTAGETVAAGDLLFRMYAPALVNAQGEYLQALQSENKTLAAAARERLVALGMGRQQIDTLTETRKIRPLIDVRAHHGGTVLKLGVAEGMYVKPDDMIMDIADLSSVWVMVEIFEDQAAWLAEDQPARMQLSFAPGRTWKGTVDYVYPTIDADSRTLRARLVFENRDRVLKPNMYADITIDAAPRPGVLHIPRMALIQTENAERVILSLGEGRFRPARVVSGVHAGDRVEITEGLEIGERVVTSGQFLIDSEASLDASLLRLTAAAGENGKTEPNSEQPRKDVVTGRGTVTAIDTAGGRVTLAHDPIPEVNWPAMTMPFAIKQSLAAQIAVGDRVEFQMMEMPGGNYMITAVEKTSVADDKDGVQ
jgi:Cu(I)/Ag(I) efflux system membrane fusion protein